MFERLVESLEKFKSGEADAMTVAIRIESLIQQMIDENKE